MRVLVLTGHSRQTFACGRRSIARPVNDKTHELSERLVTRQAPHLYCSTLYETSIPAFMPPIAIYPGARRISAVRSKRWSRSHKAFMHVVCVKELAQAARIEVPRSRHLQPLTQLGNSNAKDASRTSRATGKLLYAAIASRRSGLAAHSIHVGFPQPPDVASHGAMGGGGDDL